MPHRFFCQEPLHENRAVLSGSDSHHLKNVMRLKLGDEVTLFDGTGMEYVGRISDLQRNSVQLEIVSRAEVDRELPRRIVIGTGLPKGDRQRWLVEKLVELGVARLIPLESQFSVSRGAPSAVERHERHVIEASKQCGRNRLMEVSRGTPWVEFLRLPPPGAHRLLAHPRESAAANFVIPEPRWITPGDLAAIRANDSAEIWIACGPEGGFSDEELGQAIAQNWSAVSLGKRILRSETACLALAALCGLP